ncbi:YbaN family protein [Deinococcus roseus]|uniref:DUF454 domain-containing protein n=1 Tax=Deinococcus roseus TaxID=392414 RepID=A0ABQ2CV23_9DEIO|nr:YbaN family protein [Deinococcus roseus]GGJ23641.1 hypothetical protein GCM10008938_07290 [Deinococcus roseus]
MSVKQAPAWLRPLWIVAGFVCVGLGFVGFYTPGMPGTVFFVLAAACFARSSPRFYTWLLNLPVAGPLLRDFQAGLGMPHKAKVLAIGMIVLSCAVSSVLVYGRILKRTGNSQYALLIAACIAGLGLVGIWYISLKVPTREKVMAN